MSKFQDLTGQTFGRLTVINFLGKDKSGNLLFKCQCICGKIKINQSGALKAGIVTSCGCYQKEVAAKLCKSRQIHGEAVNGIFSPEYIAYRAMKHRCYVKSDVRWERYGGRGIKVCRRWLGKNGYIHFLTDMGRKPGKEYSLDRINNDGNYSPSNCRWATRSQQMKNRQPRSQWHYKKVA